MADNIANILMRLTGESDDAESTLENFLRKVQAFGKTEATAEANVKIGDGELRLFALMTQLATFADIDATAEANVDVDEGGLAAMAASLEAFAAAGIDIPVDVKETAALAQMAALMTAAQAISNQDVEVPVDTTNLQSLQGLLTAMQSQDNAIEIDVETAEGMATLIAFLVAAEGLARDIDVDVDVDSGEGLSRIAAVATAVQAVDDSEISIGVDTERLKFASLMITKLADVDVSNNRAALAGLTALMGAVQAVSDEEVDIPVDTDNLISLQALIRTMQAQDNDVTVGVDTATGMAELLAFLVAAQGVAQDINIEADVDIGESMANIATLASAVQAADRQDIDIDVDASKVGLGAAIMAKLASVMGAGVSSFERMGDAIGGVTVNLGPFGVKLTVVTGAVIALAAAMAISLVAALSLLVSSLASATAAVLGLATALVGALGPAVAVIAATIGRITKIVSALKARSAAEKDAAKGSAAYASAEERRHDAALAVAGAIRNVTGAERGLQQAKDSARDAIVSANRDETAAYRALGDATEAVSEQFIEANKAMAQSVEDVKDAILNLEGAEIGVERSAIATERAKIKLEELRGEAGATSSEFDRLFNKFTDVAIDFDASQLAGIVPGGDAGGGTTQLDIADAILDVRDSKLQEKLATNQLADSERDLNEKRATAAKFAREGVAAYAPYTAALRSQADASERLSIATERSNELEQQGIDNAPAVIAAAESLKDANDRLAEARHNAANAAEGAAGGAAAKKAKQEWDALTESEKSLGEAFIAAGAAIRTSFQPAVEGMLAGIGGAVAKIPAILAPLTDSFEALGEAMGRSVNSFAALLASPAMSNSFQTLIDGAAELAQTLGGRAFQAFFVIMTNIATAAMPLLLDASAKFAGWLERIAGKTGDQKKLGASFQSLGEHLYGILGLIKAVANIFIGFFSATSGDSKAFVATLTGMAQGLANFFKSAEGQERVQQFFASVIPLAVQSLKFLGNIIIFILQLVEAIAPALSGVLAAFNLLFGVINRVLNIMQPFLKVGFQIALLFIGGLPKALGVFLSKFRLLAPIASFLTKHIVGTVTAIIGRISAIASAIPGVFDKVKTWIFGFISFIGKKFGEVTEFIAKPFREAIKAITDLGKGFFNAGKAVIQNIIDGIVSLAKDIGGVAGKVFNFLVDKLPGSEPRDKSSPLAGLADRGRAIMQNIALGIAPGADDLAAAMHRSLIPVVAGIDHNVQFPRGRSETATPLGGGRGDVNIGEVNLKGPGTELIDPTVASQKFLKLIERAGGVPAR
jgi:hypothetical protein